eukprot:4083425-Amphidinium_carterae.1
MTLEKCDVSDSKLTSGLTDRSFRHHAASLRILLIYGNRLASVLPEQGLLRISSLAVFCALENRLTGALPTHGLAGWTLVFELDLDKNRFTGVWIDLRVSEVSVAWHWLDVLSGSIYV